MSRSTDGSADRARGPASATVAPAQPSAARALGDGDERSGHRADAVREAGREDLAQRPEHRGWGRTGGSVTATRGPSTDFRSRRADSISTGHGNGALGGFGRRAPDTRAAAPGRVAQRHRRRCQHRKALLEPLQIRRASAVPAGPRVRTAVQRVRQADRRDGRHRAPGARAAPSWPANSGGWPKPSANGTPPQKTGPTPAGRRRGHRRTTLVEEAARAGRASTRSGRGSCHHLHAKTHPPPTSGIACDPDVHREPPIGRAPRNTAADVQPSVDLRTGPTRRSAARTDAVIALRRRATTLRAAIRIARAEWTALSPVRTLDQAKRADHPLERSILSSAPRDLDRDRGACPRPRILRGRSRCTGGSADA